MYNYDKAKQQDNFEVNKVFFIAAIKALKNSAITDGKMIQEQNRRVGYHTWRANGPDSNKKADNDLEQYLYKIGIRTTREYLSGPEFFAKIKAWFLQTQDREQISLFIGFNNRFAKRYKVNLFEKLLADYISNPASYSEEQEKMLMENMVSNQKKYKIEPLILKVQECNNSLSKSPSDPDAVTSSYDTLYKTLDEYDGVVNDEDISKEIKTASLLRYIEYVNKELADSLGQITNKKDASNLKRIEKLEGLIRKVNVMIYRYENNDIIKKPANRFPELSELLNPTPGKFGKIARNQLLSEGLKKSVCKKVDEKQVRKLNTSVLSRWFNFRPFTKLNKSFNKISDVDAKSPKSTKFLSGLPSLDMLEGMLKQAIGDSGSSRKIDFNILSVLDSSDNSKPFFGKSDAEKIEDVRSIAEYLEYKYKEEGYDIQISCKVATMRDHQMRTSDGNLLSFKRMDDYLNQFPPPREGAYQSSVKHCEAGQGRSVTVMICDDILHTGELPSKISDNIKKERPGARGIMEGDFRPDQRCFIYSYFFDTAAEALKADRGQTPSDRGEIKNTALVAKLKEMARNESKHQELIAEVRQALDIDYSRRLNDSKHADVEQWSKQLTEAFLNFSKELESTTGFDLYDAICKDSEENSDKYNPQQIKNLEKIENSQATISQRESNLNKYKKASFEQKQKISVVKNYVLESVKEAKEEDEYDKDSKNGTEIKNM